MHFYAESTNICNMFFFKNDFYQSAEVHTGKIAGEAVNALEKMWANILW